MEGLTKQEAYTVYALDKLGALTPAQLDRYLFENGICGKFDLRKTLTLLKEGGMLKQEVSINGIAYGISEDGRDAVEAAKGALSDQERKRMEEVGGDLLKRFRKEQDYLARYSEQATGIIPLFLSIRDGDKILFKVNVIVRDAQTAERIAKNWPENADKAYRAVWDCIGEGMPFPDFKGILGEERT